MGKTTISWCHFTFNLWWGCWKISPGCQNCYAATFDRRVHGKNTDHWDRTGSRRFMSDTYWQQLRKWNELAKKDGVRYRVFIGSMCDWAEKHPDPDTNRQMDAYRGRMWEEIKNCPHLDFLLLTKRIENAREFLPWMTASNENRTVMPWHNVWLGTTAENQEYADKRVPELLKLSAVVHFLSLEPLLGPIDLRGLERGTSWSGGDWLRTYRFEQEGDDGTRTVIEERINKITWVIAGAESGHHARPCQVDWLRSIREQCAAAGTAFFLKQAVWKQPITIGLGSKTKGKGFGGAMVEMPYLDGRQHLAFPRAA